MAQSNREPDGEGEMDRPAESTQLVGATRRHVAMNPTSTFRYQVPISKLESFITPSEDLYVIAHMGIARVNLEGWELRVEGAVEQPLKFNYGQLRDLPSQTVTAFLECYGNPVEPDVPTRRVGNVTWRGVSLREVLREAGVRPHAEYVWLEGEDSGTFANIYSDRYIKDIPLAKALEGEVILAYEMNGSPLSEEHGFPVRAVVPGFFGTNSVKWLSRVYLAQTRPESLYTTKLYNRTVGVGEKAVRSPVREVDVHSVIVRPAQNDTLNVGKHTITGWAWGAYEVTRVEVSTDAGANWANAQVESRGDTYTWQRFAFHWEARNPSRYELQCRATDAQNRVQPPHGRNEIYAITVVIA